MNTDSSLTSAPPPLRYRPSPWEQFWAREIQRLESDSPLWEDGCGQVRADKVLVAQMSGDLSVFNHSYCQPTGINYALSLDVFSAMEVSERCELPGGSATMRHNHTIEPLVSFLRDPRAVCALEARRRRRRRPPLPIQPAFALLFRSYTPRSPRACCVRGACLTGDCFPPAV